MEFSRLLVRIEIGLALVAGALGVLTLFWHDWIEAVSGWSPDRHDGRLEWLIAFGLVGIAVGLGLRAHRRRPRVERGNGAARLRGTTL